MYVWGLYKQCTYNGYRYFLTIVDDHSRMTWIYLLRLKSDVTMHITSFLTLVKNQFSTSVKIVRTDNGLEFFNSQCNSLFNSFGIIHQSTCVHTPQQNGIAERKHRHFLKMAKALRFQAHIPLKFWGECVSTAAFLINRLPSTLLSKIHPMRCFMVILLSLITLKYLAAYAMQPSHSTLIHSLLRLYHLFSWDLQPLKKGTGYTIFPQTLFS
ncbi:hypothetical protein RDI58_011131 [Solanum bulbocastanum]|uniref:Integrase catalytic domain-containing protein n=1 Tax=Solanum bulbocastanum TaxID=147425 RepID=A0AAN8TQI8_SOLBU